MDRIRLIAEYSLTYAPHHVAQALELFQDAGLAVETNVQSGPGGSWLADVLARGEADVARGGVWIPMMYRDHLEDLRIFAALCHRNAQVLLSRTPEPDFTLDQLLHKRVMLPMAATSQWMYLRGLFEEAGVDWSKVLWLRDLEVSTMARLWRAGYADYFLTSAPLADELLAQGFHAALDLADTGAVPWSVYYAARGFVDARADVLTRFTAALGRAAQWIHDNDPADTARLIARDFPAVGFDVLTASIRRMRQKHTWDADMTVPQAALARYQAMIASYGLIPTPLPYAQIIAAHVAADADAAKIAAAAA